MLAHALPLLLVLVALLAGCAPSERERTFHSRKALYERQNRGLRELIEEASRGSLVPVDEFLVGVDEKIVAEIFRAGLPVETSVGERVILRIEQATVHFEDKYGDVTVLARLIRRAAPDKGVVVRARGGLGAVEIDPATDRLKIKIAIDHVEIEKAGMLDGVLGGAAKDLIAARGKTILEDAIPPIEVPVGLAQTIRVPALQEGPVALDSLVIPLDVSVKRVLAVNRKLWVTLNAEMGTIQGAEGGLGVDVRKKKRGGGK